MKSNLPAPGKRQPLAAKKKTAKAIIADLVAALEALRSATATPWALSSVRTEVFGKMQRVAKASIRDGKKFLASKTKRKAK